MKTLFDLAHIFSSCFEHNFSICEISVNRAKLSSVPQNFRGAMLLLAALTLTHCTAKKPTDPLSDVTGPGIGMLQSELLLDQIVGTENPPSAALGIFVANYLVNISGVHLEGAMDAVNIGLGLLIDDQETASDSFALLQQLGVVLQVDVPDMLNRGTDRQETLDSYISTLSAVYDRSKAQVTALKQEQKMLLDAQHDKRTIVTQIQHDLNVALQKEDYGTASAKQSAIVEAKAEQSKAETEVNQINSTLSLYTNLNQIANKRLNAIQSNREVLIAGLSVVNVPGIDDLDILKKGNGSQSTNGTSLFGSPGL